MNLGKLPGVLGAQTGPRDTSCSVGVVWVYIFEVVGFCFGRDGKYV